MKRNRWNMQAAYLPGCLLLLSACALPVPTNHPNTSHPHQEAGQASPPGTNANKHAGENQIVFLTMSIRQDSSQANRTIKIHELIKKPGTIKKSGANLFPGTPYLSCILYADMLRLDSIQLEHPLFRHLEYVNDHNQLTRKAIQAKESEFFIRFQQGGSSHLTIEERLPHTLPKTLITIKL